MTAATQMQVATQLGLPRDGIWPKRANRGAAGRGRASPKQDTIQSRPTIRMTARSRTWFVPPLSSPVRSLNRRTTMATVSPGRVVEEVLSVIGATPLNQLQRSRLKRRKRRWGRQSSTCGHAVRCGYMWRALQRMRSAVHVWRSTQQCVDGRDPCAAWQAASLRCELARLVSLGQARRCGAVGLQHSVAQCGVRSRHTSRVGA